MYEALYAERGTRYLLMITGRDLIRYNCMYYDTDSFDCADLVILVQKELFQREVHLPTTRARGRFGERQIQRQIHGYVEPTEHPKDGDLVLMKDIGSKFYGHVGVYLMLAGEPSVLHTTATLGTATHPIRFLSQFGVGLKGFYTWITACNSPKPPIL